MNTAFIGKLAMAAVTANSVRLPDILDFVLLSIKKSIFNVLNSYHTKNIIIIA